MNSFSVNQLPLFANVSPETAQKLRAIMRIVTFSKGRIIMLEGDENAAVFLVLAGAVRVFKTNPDGREQTLHHIMPGKPFNLPAAFTRDHRSPASVQALSDVRAARISQADFRRITIETPEIALAVLSDLSAKLQHFVNLTHDLSLRSVRGRLAKFLLENMQQTPDSQTWTQTEIAQQIGSVRVVVSRTLKAFAQEGFISTEGSRIVILNSQALQHEIDT